MPRRATSSTAKAPVRMFGFRDHGRNSLFQAPIGRRGGRLTIYAVRHPDQILVPERRLFSGFCLVVGAQVSLYGLDRRLGRSSAKPLRNSTNIAFHNRPMRAVELEPTPFEQGRRGLHVRNGLRRIR